MKFDHSMFFKFFNIFTNKIYSFFFKSLIFKYFNKARFFMSKNYSTTAWFLYNNKNSINSMNSKKF